MRTTAQLKQEITHYQIAIEVINICQQLAPAITGKMFNKRVTDKIAATIDEQAKQMKQENFKVSTVENTRDGLDIKIICPYNYNNRFTVIIRGPYGTGKNIRYASGRLDASTLVEFCQHSAQMYAIHIEDAQKAINAMPAAVAFLQSVINTCKEIDKTPDIFTGLLCHTSDILDFLRREAGEE